MGSPNRQLHHLQSALLAQRVAPHPLRRSFLQHYQRHPIRHRPLSSSASSAAAATPPPAAPSPVLTSLTAELDRLAPRIDLHASQISILDTPAAFHATLLDKLRHANSRIYLSTLYIGPTEHALVGAIRDALASNPDLRVSILTDALRGTREAPRPSCAGLLAPLAADFPAQVEVRLYHTPRLTGWRKRLVPNRINEGWGLQHMKLYGVDDEVILSGANLSRDYFTNRQDRYHVLASAAAAGYFARVHGAMCATSFRLRARGATEPEDTGWELEWPADNAVPNPLDDPRGFERGTQTLFAPLAAPHARSSASLPRAASPPATAAAAPPTDTTLYPLLTVPAAHNAELPALAALLAPAHLPADSRFLFTAGYFNPHPAIAADLLRAAAAPSARAEAAAPRDGSAQGDGGGNDGVRGTVLTASPWANGFFGAPGVAGMLPGAYTLLARHFLRRVRRGAARGRVAMREWRHGTVGEAEGWTYHAKGLWITLGGENRAVRGAEGVGDGEGPSVTVVGSSNYTTRSNSLDTEVGAVLVTADPGLRERLRAEEEYLLAWSREVSERDLSGGERRVGLKTRVAMWIVKLVGGSL